MSELEGLGILLFKMETLYNTDPVPGVGDAILVGSVKVAPIHDLYQPKAALSYFGDIAAIPIGNGISLSFQTEFRGSGTNITPTKLGMFLRCAGLAETIGASYVDYDETTATDTESGTAYWYSGNKVCKASGLVTKSIKPSLEANKPGIFTVEMVGMWAGMSTFVAEQSAVTPTFGSLQIPPVLQSAAFAIDSYSALISKLELGLENTVVAKKDASSTYGIKRYMVTDRKITFSCDPELVALSTYNPWTSFDAGTTGALTIQLGGTAGNIMVITSPRIQKTKVEDAGRDGIKVYSISGEAKVSTSSGNDRIKFRTK